MTVWLDILQNCAHSMGVMANYSTAQVARKAGVDKKTLLRWLYSGKLAEPKIVRTPGSVIRVWSEGDLKRATRYKDENYCKGRGRKAASKN